MEALQVEATRNSRMTAFSIPDLMLLEAWSEFHGMRMEVDLGHCMDGAECDEIIVLSESYSPLHWMLWRSADQIVVQSMLGAERRSDTISEALDSIGSTEVEELIDIHPSQW